jgi:general secretion pathway protein C
MIALVRGQGRDSWLTGGLPKMAAAGLVVLIAWALANLTWRVLTPAPDMQAQVPLQAPALIDAPEQRPDYAAQIASLHIFGQVPPEQPVQLLKAPETHLNLALRGVYATGDDQALAIIASGGRNEKFYRLGDTIAGGPTLKAVYGDRVILQNNLRPETLRLPKSTKRGISLTPSTGLAPGAANDFSDLAALYTSEQAAYRATTSTLPATTAPNVDLGRLRTQILQNPGRLGDMLTATPASTNGQFMGYRLSPQGNPQLFNQLGLHDGDIVTSVNGIAIDRPDKGLQALQALIKANQVNVTVLRNDTKITLAHSLR